MAASELPKIKCGENGAGAGEPVPPSSPFSKVYLKFMSPKSEEVMHCTMSFKDPIDVEALKKDLSNSLLIKHPRFCSLLIRDHSGEHWVSTRVNIDDHIIVHHNTATTSQLEDNNNGIGGGGDDYEDDINSFLAEISVSTPLNENKPLWEVHVLLGFKCVVLRVHHALGDGVSLMSLLVASFGKKRDNSIIKNNNNNKGDHKIIKKGVWRLVLSLWITFVNAWGVLWRLLLWVKDKRSVISGGDGVELLPRKLVTTKFLLEDFKSIKTAIPQVTVNDVLLGVISSGLSKYLNAKSPMALKQAHRLSAILPVNVRKEPYIKEISDLMSIDTKGVNGWGNKTSFIFLPIRCSNDIHPLDHVREIKAFMDTKKHYSFEAYYYFKLGIFIANFISIKALSSCFNRFVASTTLCISNVGLMEELVIADNPVTQIKGGISSNAQAITIHMISYAGKANLQVMVAKDIVPDPETLVNFFQESFLEMKNSININK